MRSLLAVVASGGDLLLPPNPQSFKASKPTDKLMMPLPIVKKEGKGEENIIIVDLGIKKRSVPLGVMPGKRKRPKSLIPTDRLPDWVVSVTVWHMIRAGLGHVVTRKKLHAKTFIKLLY